MIDTKTSAHARVTKPAPDCTLVIFGVTGDLAHRLLMPALYNLSRCKLLPERFAIIGVGRSEIGSDELRDDLTRTTQGFVADKGGEFAADSLVCHRFFVIPSRHVLPSPTHTTQPWLLTWKGRFGPHCD